MHHLTGVLVDQQGEVTAVETYRVAGHCGQPAGDVRRNYATGLRSADRFERRDPRRRIGDRATVAE
ncbi:hypothetical protein [Frankia sp. Cr2]|uniref:hypothetical protein n=1 Tax=Frankia sp. Cr2 TaxID=3073932 RepID=UPI002AD59429|nr:hypothetical protein [Frankia sp. Cr2]